MPDYKFRKFETIKMIKEWKGRCCSARDGHYEQSEKLFKRSEFLGYILIYCTVFVTVFSFFNLDKTFFGFFKVQYFVVLAGCVSAVISGIVTQSKYGGRAEMHRSSAAKYATLARDFEILQFKIEYASSEYENEGLKKEVVDLINDWSDLSEESLLTPHEKGDKWFRRHRWMIIVFIILFFITVSGTEPAQKVSSVITITNVESP